MVLRRLFTGPEAPSTPGAPPAPAPEAASAPASDEPLVPRPAPPPDTDTETIRRIAAQLQELPMERRRFIGGFAYVLGRAAHADLSVTPDEVEFMERTVAEIGELPPAQAVLVVEIARAQAELQGATEDYLVTREFAAAASREDRERLLRLAFSVTAADHSITAEESAELNEIGKELGFTAGDVDKVRVDFADQLSAIQAMRRSAAG